MTRAQSKSGGGSAVDTGKSGRLPKGPRRPEPGQSFGDLCPQFLLNWADPTVEPFSILRQSNLPTLWHCRSCSKTWSTSPASRLRRSSEHCPACARKERAAAKQRPQPGRSFADLHPALLQDLAGSGPDPSSVGPSSSVKLEWRCPGCTVIWLASPADRRHRKTAHCPDCARQLKIVNLSAPKVGRSFGDIYPKLIKFLADKSIDPFAVPVASNVKLPWRCPTCHQVRIATPQSIVSSRTPQCRACAIASSNHDRSVPVRGQAFSDFFPILASRWHPTLNGSLKPEEVRPGSSRRVWLLCLVDGSHAPSRSVVCNLAKMGDKALICIECRRKASRKASRGPRLNASMAHRFPAVCKFWDTELNQEDPTEIAPMTTQQFWWRCKVDARHVWRTTPKSMCVNDSSCPKCIGHGTSRIEKMIGKGLGGHHAVIQGAKIPCAEIHVDLQPDFLLPLLGLVVEFDSWIWHASRTEPDRKRLDQYRAAGYEVIRLREIATIGTQELALLGRWDVQVPQGGVVNCRRIVALALAQVEVFRQYRRTHPVPPHVVPHRGGVIVGLDTNPLTM
jgi:hypothetical protein